MNVEETAQKISSMEIRGAGKIARAAAEAMKECVLNLNETKPKEVINALSYAMDTLQNTRPTAVSLANALHAVMSGAKGENVEEIRASVIKAADKFITNSNQAVEKIASVCANRIQNGYTILTHCNSSVAVNAIITAHNDGKQIRVYSTETRPWGQGYITSQALADTGVDVTLIVDSAARHFMAETDLVIIGADTVTSNGTVYNKIGTSQIALCAHERHVPVIVCAETYKFSRASLKGTEVIIEERDHSEIIEPEKLQGVKVRNPVFDATQPEYISEIITELGIITPQAAYDIIKNSL